MSSTMGEHSTIDEFDGDESTIDRYSVNTDYYGDGRESTIGSGSSYDSGTYGTSCASEGSETLGEEEDYSYDEELEDLDNMSLASEHMLMDRFVDSSCTCLDYPAMLYQRLCMQTETSLLRESKGIPRSSILNISNSKNLSIAAAKRRNLRLKGKTLPVVAEANEGELSERKSEMRELQIQPREDVERKIMNNIKPSPKQEPEKMKAIDTREGDSTSHLEPTETRSENYYESEQLNGKRESNEAEENASTHSTKSMLERAIQKVAKEEEERDEKLHLSNSSLDTDSKAGPPSDEELAFTREDKIIDRHSAHHREIGPLASDRLEESTSTKEEIMMDIPDGPSDRSECSSLPPPMEEGRDEVSQKSDNAQRTDEKSAASSMDIIDVISIDDQDSWTPGSRNDVDRSTTESTVPQHPDHPNTLSTEVWGDQQHDRPHATDASTVDELWVEEEAKLTRRAASTRMAPSAPKDHTAVKSAEDLWNEERMKLQTISDVVIRSQSRRELIQKVLQGAARERSLSKSRREARSSSAGRIREDIYSTIDRNQGLASKSMVHSHGSTDSLNSFLRQPSPSRSRDLVAVRSIEEAQRMRTSRRDTSNFSASAHQRSDARNNSRSSHRRPRYDEYPDPSLHQPELDHLIRSLSRDRSLGRDSIGRRDFASEDRQFLLSDSRDDQDSLSTPNVRNKPNSVHIDNNWSSYDTAASATKELRKLEKKIERQIRRADSDAQMEQSTDTRRMERKLSKKLRSIIKSDETKGQKMSSRDIKKLEKQLAQTLSGDHENRSSRLKKIKHKGFLQGTSSQSSPNELRQSNGYSMSHSQSESPYFQESREKRPERSRYEDLKSLRSRYVRRGIGRRSYSRMSDTD